MGRFTFIYNSLEYNTLYILKTNIMEQEENTVLAFLVDYEGDIDISLLLEDEIDLTESL